VQSGGTVTATTVSSGGTMSVQSGGLATATTLLSGGHRDGIVGRQRARDQAVERCDRLGLAGANWSSTTVSSGGTLNVSTGGSVLSTTVLSGFENVSSGGTASVTTVSSGAC